MKRMISLLLALCLLGSMIPFQAFATENAPPPETVVGEAPTEETCEEQADAEDIDSTVPATVMDEPDDVEAAAVRGLDIDRIEIPTIYLTEGLDGRYEWGYYWDEELHEYITDLWFQYNIAPGVVTIYYDDVTYQWYYSNDGKSWAKSGASGSTTDTLSVQVIAYRLGQMYRCVITDSQGSQVISNVVSMNLPESTIVIHAQPASFVGGVGDTAAFSVEATGEGLTYRWYYSTEGVDWTESWTTGYNTPTATPVLREYNSGRLFKCLITDKNGNTAWTEAVSMSLGTGDIIITSQPSDYLGRLNDLAEFTVEAEGVNLTYRWYFSTDGGETWAESWSTGYNSDKLSVRIHAYRDGYMYKCVIRSGVDQEIESAPATLNKLPTTVKITAQPTNAGGPIGTTAIFTIGATGEGLSYQWQYSNNGGETWVNSSATGAKTGSISVAALAYRNGQMYRCIITNEYGSVISDAATLTVQ